jgi:hypothetical protein
LAEGFILSRKSSEIASVYCTFEYLISELMKPTALNHGHPSNMEARYISEIRNMSPQQRFEKLIAIIEISFHLKNAKRIKKKIDG